MPRRYLTIEEHEKIAKHLRAAAVEIMRATKVVNGIGPVALIDRGLKLEGDIRLLAIKFEGDLCRRHPTGINLSTYSEVLGSVYPDDTEPGSKA